jgi:hypothetical protein
MITPLQNIITWIPVAERLPDDCTTVLLFDPSANEPVVFGFIDAGEWRTDDMITCIEPSHWADIPAGPHPSMVTL